MKTILLLHGWSLISKKKHKNSQKFAKKERKSLQQHYISIPWALGQVGCGVSNLRVKNSKLDLIIHKKKY